MLDRTALFDPELVSRLSRHDLDGPPSPHPHRGMHRSPRRGASLEFSEHTEYAPGDDLRDLDWKVYAKSDRYFVKRYEDERLQRALLVVDASASMAYGGEPGDVRGSKYHWAARVAVALAAVLLRQGDAVGIQLAGGGEAVYLPPRSGMPQLEAVLELLGPVRPEGRADLESACRTAGERLRRSASVFLISDFLDEGDQELAAPGLLRARGLAPRVVHLLHRDEVDLPFDQITRFLDLEGSAQLVLDPAAVRRAYVQEIQSFVQATARSAARLGLPYAFFATNEDPAPALARMIPRLKGG